MGDESYRSQIERFRRDREDGLRSEDGWLSQVELVWFDGERADLDVGSFHGVEPGVRFVPAAGKTVRLAGDLVTEALLRDDRDDGPDILACGTRRYQLVRRGGALAVRVRDTEAPRRRAFRGLTWYPVVESWRVVGTLDRSIAARAPMQFTSGQEELVEIPGTVRFTALGATHRLVPYARADGSLLIVFRDATNADETCEICRYFVAPPPDRDDHVILDFNLAAAPACAFVPFVTCVLPPPENSLGMRIEAGERRYIDDPDEVT